MESFQKILSSIFDFFQLIVMALAVFVISYLFVFQPSQVKGQSMHPNFKDGELLITEKVTYHFRTPQRGEIIIFKSPKNPEVDYIKRIIALPGESVMLSNSTFYINGVPLKEDYIKVETTEGVFLKEGETTIIPQGYVLAIGDNRPHSSDSREFGPIKIDSIIGRAIFRYWPLTSLGLITKTNY